MICTLTITKFKTWAIPFAFIGMALLRLPLYFNQKCTFWKLLGSGKNAEVDQGPDFKHWAILTCWNNYQDAENFNINSWVSKWFKFFSQEQITTYLRPLKSHGTWDKRYPFPTLNEIQNKDAKIAVLTRATIRIKRVIEFQKNVKNAADAMRNSDGIILAAGIGESPFFRQATFSIWANEDAIKNYAYKNINHAEVIKKTRERDWYTEELFARFEVLHLDGKLNNKDFKI